MIIENEVLEKLLIDIYNNYGYDFTQYSRASIQRRINTFLFLNAILCSRGYQFITAESGKDGLEK